MIIDQEELDALLEQAHEDRAAENAVRPAATPAKPQPHRPSASPGKPNAALNRLLRIKVPVIVQLAARRMPVAAIRRLSLGTIIEFHRSIDDPLELLINNRAVGSGEAVKVGENYGLRLHTIGGQVARINALGR